MLTQIGEDETDDMQLDRLIPLLHRNLWGKKYLIVLDDARDADPWYYNLGAEPNMEDEWKSFLAYGLPKGSGGRVVVTGRNEEVARKMVGEHNLHKVLPLSDQEDCWSLFKESVGPCLDEEANKNGMNLEAMKGEVHAKSNGMPLAIKIMGQIMKERLTEASAERISRTATD
ncbi:hypothetical protein MLD38_039845 [Melastoma candidum]|nr:hypothetical protein MLD38_039845 [Melastoma candidum]